jgi:hypothetical protein
MVPQTILLPLRTNWRSEKTKRKNGNSLKPALTLSYEILNCPLATTSPTHNLHHHQPWGQFQVQQFCTAPHQAQPIANTSRVSQCTRLVCSLMTIQTTTPRFIDNQPYGTKKQTQKNQSNQQIQTLYLSNKNQKNPKTLTEQTTNKKPTDPRYMKLC